MRSELIYLTRSETKNFCCSKGLKPLVKTILSNRSTLRRKKIMKRSVLVVLAAVLGFAGCKTTQSIESGRGAAMSIAEKRQNVLEYIAQTQGKAIITGQQESTWMTSADYEVDYIEKTTGKLPALRGLDFMHDDFDGVVKRAQEWWQNGGLVTICWHTGAAFSGEWKDAMEDEVENWDEWFIDGSEARKKMIAGMDKAASALKKLEDAGVIVLWRPFHEMDGGWFWWGKGGSENFIKLWRAMYERFTTHWGLSNLIWVQGFSHEGKAAAWYVGDEFCDIIGGDSYEKGANKELYDEVKQASATKPICFHECGTIPSEAELKEAGAKWAYFMTWHTDYITKSENNDPARLKEIYNSDYFITRDELPSFDERK